MKTIFFDFGNVLAFFDHQRAVAKLARYTDMPPVELTLDPLRRPDRGRLRDGQAHHRRVRPRGKLNGRLTCTDDEFLTAFADIFWRNDEVCDLIPRLKPRYRLVLASNTNDAHFRRYTPQFADVLRHFDHLVPVAPRRGPQAAPGVLRLLPAVRPRRPGECLFVDDLPVNVEAAERLGWKGVVYHPAARWRRTAGGGSSGRAGESI